MNSIIVPDSLPEILKNYVKAAIRSQPEDILSWSAEYFKTSDEQSSSVTTQKNGYAFKQDRTLFRILAFQLGTTIGTKERIEEVWSDLSLDYNLLQQIYKIGRFHDENVNMVEFLGVTFGHWTKSLKETMLSCCEAYCKCLATDGYFLHVDVACKLYGFLAKLDCSLPVDNDDGRRRTGALDNVGGKTLTKTTQSLDAQFSPWSENGPSDDGQRVRTSLESVVFKTSPKRGNGDHRPADSDGCGYYVPGIGPIVPSFQVQTVFEYFRKCAAENGGYVYDFDIEHDNCPRLDANNC